VAVDDADVEVVDQQQDVGAGEAGAEADVVEAAVVAEGDAAAAVDLVLPDPRSAASQSRLPPPPRRWPLWRRKTPSSVMRLPEAG
jgi:hypothetical protein